MFYRKLPREESIHRFRSQPAVALFFIKLVPDQLMQMIFSSATEQDSSAMAVEIHPAKTYHCWRRTFFNNAVLIFENWVDEERTLNMQTNEKFWLLSVFLALIKFKMC